jgi:hypothetical protein
VADFIGEAGGFSFQALAGPTRENSLATLIVAYQDANYADGTAATAAPAVGVTLMVLSLSLIGLVGRARGQR